MSKKKHSKQPPQVPPLDDRHYLAIELLICIDGKRPNRAVIAKKCGVSRMQLYRWELREDFQQAYEKRKSEVLRKMFPPQRKGLAIIVGDVKTTEQALKLHGII